MQSAAILDGLERITRSAVGLTAASLVAVAPRSDLTIAQWRALAVVAESAVPVRVGDIAMRLGMSLPSASRFVRRLERRGFVSTERDEADRRVTLVRVTPAGATLWAAVVSHRRAALDRALEGRATLPDGLVDGLRAIADALDDID